MCGIIHVKCRSVLRGGHGGCMELKEEMVGVCSDGAGVYVRVCVWDNSCEVLECVAWGTWWVCV